jgi:hypothetical protein
MTNTASRRPLTAEAQFRSQVSPVGFMVNKVVLGQVSLRVLQSYPVIIIPTLLHICAFIYTGVTHP